MNEARRERIRELIRTLESAEEELQALLIDEENTFAGRTAASKETEFGIVSENAVDHLDRAEPRSEAPLKRCNTRSVMSTYQSQLHRLSNVASRMPVRYTELAPDRFKVGVRHLAPGRSTGGGSSVNWFTSPLHYPLQNVSCTGPKEKASVT
jgi:hypothetical protein